MREPAYQGTAGLVVYVILSFLGSWFVASTLHVFGLNVSPGPIGTRLFTTSLIYAATMGWQPFVATWLVRRWVDPPDHLDLGLRPSSYVFTLVGVAGAVAFTVLSMALAWVAAAAGVVEASSMNGAAEHAIARDRDWLQGIISPSLAFVGTLALVWIQTFSEEIGWRGYFLPRAMERFGQWRGLVLQGAAWGCWYAPVLFFSVYGPSLAIGSVTRSLALAVTCALLGTLFGWLRLASKSLGPVITANTTLTLIAGLPYVMNGVDAGLRSAIFGPPGWIVLAAGVGVLVCSPWRSVVRIPEHIRLSSEVRKTPLTRMWIVLDGRVIDNRSIH